MKLRILNETGDTVLTDAPITEKHDRVKEMSIKEINTEFNKLVKNGYTAIDDTTNKVMKRFNKKVESVTMLYPTIGG